MCGHVGVAGVISTKDVEVFNEMLYHDYVRGKDSTGVGSAAEHSGLIKTFKGVFDPIGLMSMKGYGEVIHSGTKVLIGHNRAQTRGAINRHNAHPFSTDRILGAHNGTLDYSCMKDLENAVEGDTDSERLIRTIDALDGNLAEAVALAEGAWALVVFDKKENTINFLRNDKRPLYYCYSKSKKTLYWASEAGLLKWVLHRQGIEISGNVYELAVDTWMSWVLPKSNEIFGQPGRLKAEGKKPVNFTGPYGGRNHDLPWMDWGPNSNRSYQNSSSGGAANKSGESSKPGGDSTRNKSNVIEVGEAADSTFRWYMQGQKARDAGRSRVSNPYATIASMQEAAQWWWSGWDDAENPDNKIVNLDSRREGTRDGPYKQQISYDEFKKLTNHECGWCEAPVTKDDRGTFHADRTNQSELKWIYHCESCVKSIPETVKSESKANNNA